MYAKNVVLCFVFWHEFVRMNYLQETTPENDTGVKP